MQNASDITYRFHKTFRTEFLTHFAHPAIAAGNGMLLQAMADQFGIPVYEYADNAFEAKLSPKFSYGCAVFLDSDRVKIPFLEKLYLNLRDIATVYAVKPYR